jgi:hypothetical protein
MLLDNTTVESALNNLNDGLLKYLWLQNKFAKTNVIEDFEFQRKFNHFYRVRRGEEWRKSYFDLLENCRNKSPTFEFVLAALLNKTGKLEASFSSKLIATLNPNMPVLDSVVLKNLGLKLPISPKNKFNSIVSVYAELETQLNHLLNSTNGEKAIAKFKARFPTSQVTDIKILDFILWQSR